jgi:hypothetical protein
MTDSPTAIPGRGRGRRDAGGHWRRASGPARGWGRRALGPSEKDAKLAQKLGQLPPFIAVFAQECMGQLASFGPA